jgi:flagellar hook-basal body complex protein FliE
MSSPIQPIQPGIVTNIALPSLDSPAPSSEFRDLLSTSIAAVNQQQNDAQAAVNQFLSGDSSIELHSVALAGQRADLSMDLFLQVRNKVLSAYQEIMKLQM